MAPLQSERSLLVVVDEVQAREARVDVPTPVIHRVIVVPQGGRRLVSRIRIGSRWRRDHVDPRRARRAG
jgi:hypothetical protein